MIPLDPFDGEVRSLHGRIRLTRTSAAALEDDVPGNETIRDETAAVIVGVRYNGDGVTDVDADEASVAGTDRSISRFEREYAREALAWPSSAKPTARTRHTILSPMRPRATFPGLPNPP
ncbi:hypothetical protein SAMN05444422_10930 [Halobiforma haloterrestris]|uniref:Uncharacterized protein n=1 Tax=Natronobacterium haloterrestre TaxID=148448 RepID=A0A1I1JJ59_NATHA|nr:hypothetical protein [Halobiforma haloterrestris]SFC48375.1 hypothetical protein SAMN05444422_10930 [Halobiforma haloterrestris]